MASARIGRRRVEGKKARNLYMEPTRLSVLSYKDLMATLPKARKKDVRRIKGELVHRYHTNNIPGYVTYPTKEDLIGDIVRHRNGNAEAA